MTTFVYRSASMRDDNAEHVCNTIHRHLSELDPGTPVITSVHKTEKRSSVIVESPVEILDLLGYYAHFELKEVV